MSVEDKLERIGVIERFRLGKGITRETEGTWIKEYIKLEVKLPEKATDKDFVANFTAAEFMIDQLLEQPKTTVQHSTVQHNATPQVKITMAPSEVDALPWIASIWIRKADLDRKARFGEDAWLKEEDCRDPRLLEMLKAGDGKFELPGVYTFEHKVRPGYEFGLIVRHGPKTERKTK